MKTEANTLFGANKLEDALAKYDEAIHTCPNYLHYERAVIQSNIAACYLKMEEWKDAIKPATEALDSLTKLEKPPQSEQDESSKDEEGKADNTADNTEETSQQDTATSETKEIETQTTAEPVPATPTHLSEEQQKDVLRIRTKALLRRARARAEAGGWQNLAGAEEDYKTLSKMPGLTAADARTVKTQLVVLAPKVKEAQEKEMAEMWGKLKTLGDGILKPFGLSTNNFQMVKDEKSGGYSMNFSQGGK